VLSNDPTPTFGIAVSEPATHACNVDGAGFAPCSASPTLSALGDGAHTLQVRSTDAAGNSGVIAYAWTLDSLRPQTTMTSGPATSAPVATATATATLTFASPGAAAFECALDGAAWARCASP
jgi:large repetitive protein